MKRKVFVQTLGGVSFFILASVLFLSSAWAQSTGPGMEGELKPMVSNIHWLGHSSFRIDADDLVIYLDPFMLKADGPKADIILITHDHVDHNNPNDVARIQKDETVIVTVAKGAEKLSGNIKQIRPGEEMTVKGIPIQAIPAYNINKFRSPGVPFHPRESGYVGFIVTVKGLRIYHAGDTDFIPDMEGLEPDIALLPVSGIYVMTAEEAAGAAAAINAKVTIPMHIGGPVGSMEAADEFKEKATVPVMVLPIEK